jgi:hypothetical protein
MTQDSSNPPLTLEVVQSQLGAHGIEIRAASDSHLGVGRSAAVATALDHFGHDLLAEDVSAFAVTATATNYGDVQPDGTFRLPIADRSVWMVCLPNRRPPSGGPRGRSSPTRATFTLAVLIDANTGDYLMAASV